MALFFALGSFRSAVPVCSLASIPRFRGEVVTALRVHALLLCVCCLSTSEYSTFLGFVRNGGSGVQLLYPHNNRRLHTRTYFLLRAVFPHMLVVIAHHTPRDQAWAQQGLSLFPHSSRRGRKFCWVSNVPECIGRANSSRMVIVSHVPEDPGFGTSKLDCMRITHLIVWFSQLPPYKWRITAG